AIAALERAILRGPRPRAGTGGLAQALANFGSQLDAFRRREPTDLHPSDPRIGLSEGELADAADLVARLTNGLNPLEVIGNGPHPLAEFARRHRSVLAILSKDGGAEAALSGPDGMKIADALDEFSASSAAAQLQIAKSDYV